jgi:hypothetical protein
LSFAASCEWTDHVQYNHYNNENQVAENEWQLKDLIVVSTVSVQTSFSFFSSVALPVLSGPRPLIQILNHFSHTVGLLGWVISPSQGRYLNTE